MLWEIAAVVASTAYTLWAAYTVVSEMTTLRRHMRIQLIGRAISAGVNAAYFELVRDLKRQESPLSKEHIKSAQETALGVAENILHQQGVEWRADFTVEEMLDWIEQSVKEHKQ